MAHMAKFKCTPFLIIEIVDIRTIFAKDNHEENACFKTENMFIFALNVSENTVKLLSMKTITYF